MSEYSISHRTTYRYSSPVIQSHHILHLQPRDVAHQVVQRFALTIDPAPRFQETRLDYFGNPTTHIALGDDHREFSVVSRSEVSVAPPGRPAVEATSPWEAIAERRLGDGEGLDRGVLDYACRSQHTQATMELFEFASSFFEPDLPVLVGAQRLMKHIFSEFEFDPATTDVSTPVNQVLEQKSGVCQDFAHLQIATMRALGLPARYVSGYIRTIPPDGQERLVGSDASHAWVSVWAPETGWVDFDPTNDLINSPDHIAVAYGRDFDDVSPISGVLLGGGRHTVSVAVDVVPRG